MAIFEYADYEVPVCVLAAADRDNEKWGLSRRQPVLRVGERDGHQGWGELVELMTSYYCKGTRGMVSAANRLIRPSIARVLNLPATDS